MLLSASYAGTERHSVELANELARRGEVGLLLRNRPAEPHRRPAWEALRQSISPAVRVYPAARAVPWLGLHAAVWRFRPNVIHAHYDRSVHVVTRGGLRLPKLATVHVDLKPDFLRCDGLICLTDEQAALVPRSFPGIVAVIGNWVVPHAPPPHARLAALRTGLGLAPTDFVVGSVGRLAPVKDVAGLIESFAVARLEQARLLVVGDGSERPALAAHAAALGLAERVVFTGFRGDVRDLYPLMDVFVLNSSFEPYGLVILEAAAAGVPVIATATGGATAIALRHWITLVPVGEPAALAAALRNAQAHPQRPPPLAGFTVADSADAVASVYRRLLNGRNT